ncbi:hypothetical protein C8R44DRAFT_821426 [Mycena epipterygia]|nr:hypothetical protein C8R44DRAFT_821426 [Mycena epipterygia]
MSFPDLPEDIVLEVLCICEVSWVIFTSQTNKYLHDLAMYQTIWISLAEDLRKRGFIDR